MARLPGLGVARGLVALTLLVVLVGAAAFALGRPRAEVGGAFPSPTAIADRPALVSPSPTPVEEATPTPELEPTEPARPTETPTASTPTASPPNTVVEFTNPDGPKPDQYAPDEYPFLALAQELPTYAILWIDDNQRDVHIALTGDIDGAIEALRDAVPRGITVYFHLAEHTQDELCALQDAIMADRDELMRHGIVLMSSGCGNMEMRVHVHLSPLNPEVLAFMRARYDGPIDYEGGGVFALRPVDPPVPEEVRLTAVRNGDDPGLSTCGDRPFPETALQSQPIDVDGPGPALGALRESVAIYAGIYRDLETLSWILAGSDDYGATFLADRGGTWLEAPVFASAGGWVPATIGYCEPRSWIPSGGGTASLYLDPEFAAPTADSTELHLLIEERACSGASSPASRLLPPVVTYGSNRIQLEIAVRSVGGFATCPSNPRLPITVVLPEPLGDRELAVPEPPRY
jgi:hypothetical protein